MKRYLHLLVVLLVMLSFSVTALTATRTISGNDVTVTIEPGEELEMTLTETLSGGATVVAGSFPRADCGVDANNVKLTCEGLSAETITFHYQTAGAGTVAGTVDGVDFEDFSPETVVVGGDSAIGEAPDAEPPADGGADAGAPPPPPAPGAPGAGVVEEEEEPVAPVSRAPLTAADLADDADADDDGEANVDDEDDDGDNVPDEEDLCSNTYIGAERVTDSGCLEGDLDGAEEGTPDGCVNDDDVSAANFLDVLIADGFDGLSSLLWGMFDNWNADEVGC